MSKSIICPTTLPMYQVNIDSLHLSVSEMFSETLQGEGFFIGVPATFLRLSGCHLGCLFCDSTQIWNKKHSFLVEEILSRLETSGAVKRFSKGEHFVITGGAPLLQEEKLLGLLQEFEKRFNFVPYIEVENECTIEPSQELINYVSCWNNSPKLSNSHVELHKRFKSRVVKKMAGLDNSWFKFVVATEKDWEELNQYFLMPKLIKREQVILMPKGWNQMELDENRLFVAEMAMRECVRFSDRLHITLYDSRVGV